MKTAELIADLAASSAVVKPVRPGRPLGFGAAIGVLAAAAILVLWLGVQPLAPALGARWFWMKGAYGLAFTIAGAMALIPLARPGGRPGWPPMAIAGGALVILAMMAAMDFGRAAPDQRMAHWLGVSWKFCPFRILALAIPVFVALIVVLRRFAPTRLTFAGAAAGVTAGGLAAVVYGFYCEEWTATFIATWYTLGIAASGLMGAVAGRWVLRW